LIKLLPCILFEKYINILALEMAAQGTGTVPMVSAHFHSNLQKVSKSVSEAHENMSECAMVDWADSI